MDGALLRAAFEVAARLTTEDYEDVPITRLTCGRLREDDIVPILDQVRSDAAELRRAMLGESSSEDPDANPEDWTFEGGPRAPTVRGGSLRGRTRRAVGVTPMHRNRRPGSVLISGAGRGIGRATAELFLSRGWRVGMYDVDPDAVAEAAAGREGTRHGVLDVRDADQWRAVLQEFCGDGGLDVLVNNAGVLSSGPFTDIDLDSHRRMVDINVTGVVNGAAVAHSFLRRSPGSLLLNLCSASALYGQPTLATYGATKAAVKSLTEALDIEWRRDGIRVRSLLPLFVATEMVSRDGVRAASVSSLGVRLTAGDVAEAAWRVVHERRRPLASPHRPVGRQTKALAALSAVTPDWANRIVVSRLAR
jgi:short-subunit dehydrogenase